MMKWSRDEGFYRNLCSVWKIQKGSTMFVVLLCLYSCVYPSLHTRLHVFTCLSLCLLGCLGLGLWFGKLQHLICFLSLQWVSGCLYFSSLLLLRLLRVCSQAWDCFFVLSVTLCLAVISDCLSAFLSWLLWDAACCWATSCLLPSSWTRDYHWLHKVVYGVGTKVSYIYQECQAIFWPLTLTLNYRMFYIKRADLFCVLHPLFPNAV